MKGKGQDPESQAGRRHMANELQIFETSGEYLRHLWSLAEFLWVDCRRVEAVEQVTEQDAILELMGEVVHLGFP